MKPSIAPLVIRVMGTALSVAVISLFSATAQADIPPEPGYVEACTVQKQQKAGETCVLCTEAYHADREACVRKWMPQGYVSRCKTRGASAWSEVWCKGGADAGADGGATTDEGSSCSVGGDGATSGFNWGASFGVGFGLLIAAGRIRRRWFKRAR